MRRHLATASRLFGSAIIDQAILSCASLLAGLMLVRHAADLQYGYYVLAWNAILLLSSMQNAFFGPPMVSRLSRMDQDGGRDVVGGLYRAQRRILPLLAACSMLGILVGWGVGALAWRSAVLAAVVTVAALLVLSREYFRMVLLAYRRPLDVLKGDAVYVAIMLGGVAVATLTAAPATFAILGLGVAAGAGALLLSRSLRRHEPWNAAGARGILQEIAPAGAWSTLGAAVHWSFSQGYSYLVAGTLGVSAVAAVSATRLLLMPINLLSMGLGMVMLPLAAAWLNQHGAAIVLRRLSLFAAALVAAAMVYFALLWQFRGWLFDVVLHKHFAQRDLLLSLWFAAFTVMVMRDQLIYLLVVRSRFRLLIALTLLSAALSLSAGYFGMRLIGEAGAPFGVAIGELVSVVGILICSIRECRTAPTSRGEAAPHLFPAEIQENAS